MERVVLVGFAVLALATALLGYAGLWTRWTGDPQADLKLEAQRIIDYAQLYHARPPSSGGGGRTFVGLDFERIGLSPEPGALTVAINDVRYEFENIDPLTFDLVARAPDETTYAAREVGFDTRATVRRE